MQEESHLALGTMLRIDKVGYMSRTLTLLLLLCFFATPSQACLNDMETQSYEEEFESEYIDSDEVTAEEVPSLIALTQMGKVLNVIAGSGLLLLLFLTIRSDIRAFNKP